MLHSHNEKTRRYNEGITQLENGDFEQALNTFTEMGNFDNSGEMAEYARLEIEYKKVDGLAASGKYEEVIEILQERSTWFGDSEIGKEAGALADEYRTLTQAISDKEKGLYKAAEEKYASLNVLAESFKADRCLCLAHMAKEDRAWMDVLTYLYAVKGGDYERSFLSETEGGSSDKGAGDYDQTVREASKSGNYEAVIEVLEKDGRLEDEETRGLKTAVVNGFHYEAAQKKLDDGDYEGAMEAFQELGNFLDAPARYEEAKEKYQEGIYQKAENYLEKEKYEKAIDAFESLGDFKDAQARLAQAKAEYESYKTYKEAEKLYDNGEYYQAKKKFLSIKSYKDASKRSDECVQDGKLKIRFDEDGEKKENTDAGETAGTAQAAKEPLPSGFEAEYKWLSYTLKVDYVKAVKGSEIDKNPMSTIKDQNFVEVRLLAKEGDILTEDINDEKKITQFVITTSGNEVLKLHSTTMQGVTFDAETGKFSTKEKQEGFSLIFELPDGVTLEDLTMTVKDA